MVECPENEVITGLRIKCGSWMDQISFYCGTDGLFIPTSTPTQQSGSSGQQFYEMQWFWWAFSTLLTVAVVICYRLFLYRFSTRLLDDASSTQTSHNVECTCLDCCAFLYRAKIRDDDPFSGQEGELGGSYINLFTDLAIGDVNIVHIDSPQGENLPDVMGDDPFSNQDDEGEGSCRKQDTDLTVTAGVEFVPGSPQMQNLSKTSIDFR